MSLPIVPILNYAAQQCAAGAPVWAWFAQRIRSSREAHASLPILPFSPLETRQVFEGVMASSAAPSARVVYVHIPFCRQSCRFCGYSRELVGDEQQVTAYLLALQRQLEYLARQSWTQTHPFSALYFGGGTPTVVPAAALTALIKRFRQALPFTDDVEITVESSITDISAEGLACLYAAGVNRMSFGIQTFDGDLRHHLGRKADTPLILERLNQAKTAGFSQIAADFIYGLPTQRPEQWQQDMDRIRETPLTGCSIYPLILFPKSPLVRQGYQYADTQIQDEYAAFCVADITLADGGWQCLTPVQYARPQLDHAVYVTAYGHAADVLALGAGAAGQCGPLMYLNTPDVAAYIAGWNSDTGIFPQVITRLAPYAELYHWYRLSEGLTLNLREFPDAPPPLIQLLTALVELELVQEDGQTAALTQSGRFWAGNIAALISGIIRDLAQQKKSQ